MRAKFANGVVFCVEKKSDCTYYFILSDKKVDCRTRNLFWKAHGNEIHAEQMVLFFVVFLRRECFCVAEA